MTLHKLAAGSGYTYLTRQVAAHDATEIRQAGLASYYEEKGEAPGRWMGSGLAGLDLAVGDAVTEEQMRLLFGQGRHPRSGEPEATIQGWGALGRAFPTFAATTLRQEVAQAFSDHNTGQGLSWNAPIPPGERARIRTAVVTAAFTREHGRPPRDDAELTGFLAASSRPAQVPVAGYDLTFSPVKSVSALWALAPPEVAGQVEAAHHAAVRSTLAMLEREVAFTRVGKGGIRQVPVTGLVAAAFDHRDSRAGDPDLHTHLVVSNKVQTLPAEGSKWLTLDGRILFKAKVMASEHYNTRLEAELTDRLGVRFVDRPGPQGRRPVREIDGLDPRLLEEWSLRRRDITDRQRELAETFQADHGRAPTRIQSLALAQQANLETRPDKHEPRSLLDQRQQWRAEAETVLAGPGRVGSKPVADMLAGVLGRGRQHVVHRGGYEGGNELSTRVLAVLEASRSTWQVWHVRAEALRQARYAGVPLADLDETLRVVTERVTQQLSVPVGETPDLGEPEILRRSDGEPVYTVHGSRTYTSIGMLDAESRLIEAAERTDGLTIQEIFVRLAVDRAAEAGAALDPGQADLVARLATSGARVQVALAPAGSGKTTAISTLAKAWRAGGGDVVGLAPTAVAAAELAAAIDTAAETVAKFLRTASLTTEDRRVAAFPALGPRTLLVVDEAGMVGTKDLAAVVDHVLARGGSVRRVGDDQQLTAVAASGVFRDLAELGDRSGTTVRLTELHRFTDPAEATATLGIRDGDPTALEHYLTRGRVHVGDAGTAAEQAYDAWRADITAGSSSLLLAASRDVVRDLNKRARADRLAGQGPTRQVRLADGTHASAGDLIVTRHNDRSLRTRSGTWVKNGARWAVRSVGPDGALLVGPANRRAGGHESVTLPIGYVEQHVQLGYAGTIHGAQGATVDTTHTVLAGTESRQSLYVALSRGRRENHLYLGDDATPAEDVPLGSQPPDDGPRDLLARILDHDERAESATRAGMPDPHHELATLVQQYEDALPLLAQHVLGDDHMRALNDGLERWMHGLTAQPGYPGLRGQIAVRWADGDSPNEVLQQATWWQSKDELAGEDDPAAALARNVARTNLGTSDVGSARWLPAVPRLIRSHEWAGAYLERLAGRIDEIASLSELPGRAPDHGDRLSTGRNHQQRAVPARAPVGRGAGGPRR
ncbi:MobF family relaxase [Phycicoccus flavus]|uniref:MobF family relaxase n=1 Tax=Phycicoccus flavus TaxID=2502783 RepID=UPI000FEB837E|nr:MobF family relaxase [Phycicoccus flavus]NHA67726.1 relaxase domain-containing protein [Phycicoccus flavus]